MKYFILLILGMVAPLYSERTPETEADIDVIVRAMYSVMKAREFDTLNTVASEVLKQSPNKMSKQELIDKLLLSMDEPDSSKIYYPLFEKLYSTNEIKQIRQFYENKTFIKHMHQLPHLGQEIVNGVYFRAIHIVEHYGVPSAEYKVAPLKVLRVSSSSFEKEVEQFTGPLILFIFNDHCPICQEMMPIMEELCNQHPDIKFVIMEQTQAQAIAKKYRLRVVPSTLFFKNGVAIGGSVGYLNDKDIKDFMKDYFKIGG